MLSLAEVERRAARRGLALRLKVGQLAGISSMRVVVARPRPGEAGLWLGELKGWALPVADGMRLDTMRVAQQGSQGVGLLIWAASFAWTLEATPCRRARLLAIRDGEHQHRRLVRYFQQLGFTPVRELGAGLLDLAPRLVWGGAGLLMQGDCAEGLRRCQRRLGE